MSKHIDIDLREFDEKIPKHIKNFDPSYVTRYLITAKIIKGILSKSKGKLRILDVGGYNGAISNFFPDSEITIIDVIEDNSAPSNYIQGNASKMPFEDNQFDIVISCDTLEHVLPDDRKGFIEEIIRVSKNYVVICAPFATEGVEETELAGDSFYQGATDGESYVWLKEHREYVLPKVQWIEGMFKSQNINISSFSHTTLDLWLFMLCFNFFLPSNLQAVNKDISKKLRDVNEKYLNEIAFIDFPENGYRKFFVGSKISSINILLPEYNAEIINDFKNKDLKLIGESLSSINSILGELLSVNKKLELDFVKLAKSHEELSSELKSIKNGKPYRLSRKIKSAKKILRKI